MPSTDLGEEAFTPEGIEFHGQVNLLKAGIVYADGISTVSPTYAREIQTPALGAGLDGVVRGRRDRCWGILNGVDDDVWNPERDPLIPQCYGPGGWDGKAACKARLQEDVRLPVRSEVPLIGMITRLADQKGIDLVAQAMDHLMRLEVQLVILGSGDRSYETLLREVAARHPGRLALLVKFDNALAHRIEAGADMFLMPSRYEPCGLNQMYSLKYGTVPIARRTGGLADTVVDATPSATAAGTATGVVFEPYTAAALVEAVERALARYADRTAWHRLMLNGMRQDFSWDRAAQEYVRIYRLLHKQRMTA
jgi:starch synthase